MSLLNYDEFGVVYKTVPINSSEYRVYSLDNRGSTRQDIRINGQKKQFGLVTIYIKLDDQPLKIEDSYIGYLDTTTLCGPKIAKIDSQYHMMSMSDTYFTDLFIPPGFDAPSTDCWAHFDGVFIAPPNVVDNPDPFGGWGEFVREIFTGRMSPEFATDDELRTNNLGRGYGLLSAIAPSASSFTLDSLAVPSGVVVKFYQSDGDTVPIIEVVGPRVVYAYNRRPLTYFHHAQVTELLTVNWDGNSPIGVTWQTMFPPSARVWSDTYSAVLMRDWINYYCRIDYQ